MKKKVSIITALAVSLTTIIAPQAVAKNPPPVISQGDKIIIEGGRVCTVGYVDKEKHKAYIADHCAVLNKKSTVDNENRTEIGVINGTFDMSNIGLSQARKDVAHIDLYDRTVVGENKFSGDKRVSTRDVKIGDEMCTYSRMLNKEVHCGKVKYVDGNVVVGDRYVNGIPGDSGGPSWIPGKGFVGVYSLMIGNDIIGNDNYFTSIDDADCTNGSPDLDKSGEIDYSKMCPAGQYSERSPYVVDKVDIPYPYKIREDKPTTTTKPSPVKTTTKPTPTTTPKPVKPISGGNKTISGSGGSSDGLGLLAGFAVITGAIALLSPIVLAMMNGIAPNFKF